MSQAIYLTPTSGPGSGTVTSILFNGGLTSTPTDPITSAGTATLDQTALTVADGTVYWTGTGATGKLNTTATGASGTVLTSGGPGVAPSYQSVPASSISITGDTGGALTGAAFTFTGGTTGLSFGGAGSTETLGGTLAIANGGTNATSMTNTDGVVYYDGTRLVTTAVGTATNVLTSNGAGVAPTFQAAPAGGITTINGDSGSVTGATVSIVGSTSGAVFTGSGTTLTHTFNFVSLPTTTSANGQILINSIPVFQTFGTNNTFVGANSGNFTMTSTSTRNSRNTGIGVSSLTALAGGTNQGNLNTAIGYSAGIALTTANNSTFVGATCGNSITTGVANTFVGEGCGITLLGSSTRNTAIGVNALSGSTQATITGNIAIGQNALSNSNGTDIGSFNVAISTSTANTYTGGEASNILINSNGVAGESNTLHIGAATGTGQQQLNKAIICGINGITVTGTAVLVSSGDQLGIAVSSRKYKENINDMGSSSDDLMRLRPVTFNYKNHDSRLAYGLIAEEVAEVYPDLVVYDQSGDPQTVMYHELPALLLNEIQKLRKELNELKARL